MINERNPDTFICNIIDKYENGLEEMLAIKSVVDDGYTPDIRSLVEQAAGLRPGSLNHHARVLSLEYFECRFGDLYKDRNSEYGISYYLYYNSSMSIRVQPKEEYESYRSSLVALR